MSIRSARALAILAGASLAPLAVAAPVNITFTRVTPANAPVNPASQFVAQLNSVSSSVVSFRFTNTAIIYSSISEVYYDSRNTSPLLSIASFSQNGASFTTGGATPSNLPGGNNLAVPFSATQVFSADAQGNPSNGIDTSADWLEMRFNLVTGKTFNDVVAALNNGNLRLGLHVRAIRAGEGGGDFSDAFVNNPPIVPLPPAAWAGGALLGLVAFARARSRR